MTDIQTAQFPRATLTLAMREKAGMMSNGKHEAQHETRYRDVIGPPGDDPIITDLQNSIQYAIDTDTVLTEKQIVGIWSDAFLTNVMVPVLRRIVGVQEAALEELEDEIAREPSLVAFNRLMEEHYTAEIIVVSKMIHILEEWRG